MARVRRNIIIKGVSGNIERKVVLKQYGDATVVSSFPDMSNVTLTEKQKKENRRFSEAMAYAKSQMADPLCKAEYRARTKGMQRAHNVAIADFYHSPEIRNIDIKTFRGREGDSVIIQAVDDFKVVRVTVAITDANDVVQVTGDAVQKDERTWEFKLTKTLPSTQGARMIVRAWDKPGNTDEKVVVL